MSKYDASKIQVLKDIEAVRKRPAMYIGDTDKRGLHHLVFEVVDNSIDEAMAGFCDYIRITLHKDGSVSVLDNGRGIPVDIHPTEKRPAVEVVLTTLHAGGKFDHKVYKVAGGLHGVGISVVNALSEWLEVEVMRDGKVYYQRYERGEPKTELKVLNKKPEFKTGTLIRFLPDKEIFKRTIKFDPVIIQARARALAFLNKGIKLDVKIEGRKDKVITFKYDGGVVEFVEYLNEGRDPIHKIIYVKDERENVQLELAMQYTTTYIEDIYCYANNIHTEEGGTHLIGFKSALTKVINDFAKKMNLVKKNIQITGDDAREGLTCVLSVRVPNPQFEGQTKTKLGNSEVKGIVEGIVRQHLSKYFEENPRESERIIKWVINAARARIAAQKAREVERKKAKIEFGSLPGKLADCSNRGSPQSELYIVEGESAGGSAKQARDRRYQAILPLKGKILNVEKASPDKIFSNDEIKAIMAATGMGTGKLRYGKIILMTDADIDGSHIRTLLLTLFYRYGRDIIEKGKLFIAQPPLYKVKTKKEVYYVHSDEELKRLLKRLGDTKVEIQRYKGLGEMNADELFETTMNPKKRVIKKVTIEDAEEADRLFSILMGEKVEPRRKFIEENAQFAVNLDI